MNLSRRRVLQVSTAGLAALGLSEAPSIARSGRWLGAKPQRSSKGKAMNVVFMVADGMSYGTLTLADACHRAKFDNAPSPWVGLFNEKGVRRSTAFTYSANSLVTDSAAGATAWGIGERVNNSSICVTPDKRFPTPLWVQARQQGKAVGLVTTTTVTHATPAGFIANVPDRELEKDIAVQIMERGFDVVLGGGRMFFPEETLKKGPGVKVVRTTGELRAAGDVAGPVLGLFADGHVAYTVERPEDQPELAEKTRFALNKLFRSSSGFTLLVEGGRVDHAAHANDAGALVHDQLAFEKALQVVWEMTRDRDDTLVIVTTDHGNANPALTKATPKDGKYIKRLLSAKHSFEWMLKEASGHAGDDDGVPLVDGKDASGVDRKVDRLVELVKQHLDIGLAAGEREILKLAMQGKAVDPFQERQTFTSVLGSVLANHNAVSFLSKNHTSDMVEVTSWGPGSEQIPPMIDNYNLHDVMVRAMDLAPAKPV